MNIYLDIDGVLITKDGRAVLHVAEFLEYVTKNYDVYWLTTHCRGGESNVVEYLKGKLPKECLEYIQKIKPTDWRTLKTEAIDFTTDFLWYDDYVLEAEKKVLSDHNRVSSLRLITSDNPF